MNILFLTLIDLSNINERGIYHDLLRKFRNEGHKVYVVSPAERRTKQKTSLRIQDDITILKVKTLNIQKTNILEKGVGTLLFEWQYLTAIKKHLAHISFDIVLYSTPPITLTSIIRYIKNRDGARSYLLLKDIFPQNAVDLGLLKQNSLLHRYFIRKEKSLYKLSDRIGCMSPANKEYILRHNPEISSWVVEVNPNTIEPITSIKITDAEKRSIRSKYGLPQDVSIFLYGGNLGKPQGIDFLIEILESNISNKNSFFVIIGSGTESQKLHDWYDNIKPANIVVKKSLPKNDYDEFIKVCDVGMIFLDRKFTIPNFPSRLLAYLENEMPVIAATDSNTDLGQIIMGANCGFWCESGDLQMFNRFISKLTDDAVLKERMGSNAKKLLMQNYTVDRSYSQILNSSIANNV